eukprot:m.10956 g.10956  ORF g.10956 m.10956 type:complete len:547 (+) comp3894_c0_seq1:156-1796(+)
MAARLVVVLVLSPVVLGPAQASLRTYSDNHYTASQSSDVQSSNTCKVALHTDAYPVDRAWFGLNSVLGPIVNLTFDDVKVRAAQEALGIGSLRHPGGAVANYWYMPNGSFVGANGTTVGCSNPPHWNFCSEPPSQHPPKTFAAEAYVRGVGAGIHTTMWVANVLTISTDDAIRQIDYLKAIGANVTRIELGNEFYLRRIYAWKLSSAEAYINASKPVVQHIRTVFPDAKIAVVAQTAKCASAVWGSPGWNHVLAQNRDLFDAVVIHEYSPSNTTMGAVTSNQTLWPSIAAGWGDFSTTSIVNYLRKFFPDGIEVWRSEFNYGNSKVGTVLPDTYHGAQHGLFWASTVLAAMARAGFKIPVQATLLHAWLRGGWDNVVGIVDIPAARGGSRDDPTLVDGVAQMFAHLARVGSAQGIVMHSANVSACPVLHVTADGVDTPPSCLQAVLFAPDQQGTAANQAANHTLVVLNKCPQALTIGLSGIGSRYTHTLRRVTYHATDKGGWAPLPTHPDQLPWPAPLKPTVTNTPTPAQSLHLDPVSLTYATLLA